MGPKMADEDEKPQQSALAGMLEGMALGGGNDGPTLFQTEGGLTGQAPASLPQFYERGAAARHAMNREGRASLPPARDYGSFQLAG